MSSDGAEQASAAAQQAETFPAAEEGGAPRLYMDMTFEERDKLLKTRLKKYCQKVKSGRDVHTHHNLADAWCCMPPHCV